MNDRGLATFVAFTDEGRLKDVPVTLTVGGTIISGTIAPMSEWVEWMSKVARGYIQVVESVAAPDVATRLLHEAFSGSAVDVLASMPPGPPQPSVAAPHSSGENDIDLDQIPIHLRDASIWTPGAMTPMRLNYWRGRLDLVSGWTLGELAVNSRP